ncbi:MAG: hypothetical protein R2844_02350 [Caldilineales bacterium]
MTDRDQILDTLRAKERTVTHPPPWRSRRRFDDLAARFESALTSVAGEVVRASSLPAALDRLGASADRCAGADQDRGQHGCALRRDNARPLAGCHLALAGR